MSIRSRLRIRREKREDWNAFNQNEPLENTSSSGKWDTQ